MLFIDLRILLKFKKKGERENIILNVLGCGEKKKRKEKKCMKSIQGFFFVN